MTFGRKHKKQKRDKCQPELKLLPIRIRISNFSFQQKTDTISIASSTTPPTTTQSVTEPNLQNVSPNVPAQQQKQQTTSAMSSMKQQVITQTSTIQSPMVKLSANEVRLQTSPAYNVAASTVASSSASTMSTAMPSLVVSVPLSNANVPVTVLVSTFCFNFSQMTLCSMC